MQTQNRPSIEQAFGEVLRIYRKRIGLTQSMLADQAGLSINFISYCERGQQLPSVNSLFLMAMALRTHPAEIIEEVQKRNPMPKY